MTPHVAQNSARPGSSAIDGRTNHPNRRQFKLRTTEKVSAVFGVHVIAYNPIRLGNLVKPAMAAA